MLFVDTNNQSIGFTVKTTDVVEDLVAILMANDYWVRLKPDGKNVLVEIKEDANNGN